MPKGVYPRKPRRARRVNRETAAKRQAAKYSRLLANEMTTAARALINVANLRLGNTGGVFVSANVISALTEGLGFNRK